MLLDYKQIITDLIVVWLFQKLPGAIFGQDTKFIEDYYKQNSFCSYMWLSFITISSYAFTCLKGPDIYKL